VPFDLFRRRKGESSAKQPGTAAAAGEARPGRGVAFDGLTEEWRIVGKMHIVGRLSDALNKREAVPISEVQWAPADGSEPMTEAPGLKTVDPYDLIMVLAGEESLPPLSDTERVAHKVHKIAYDVGLEVPPFRVTGTVYLYPGSDRDVRAYRRRHRVTGRRRDRGGHGRHPGQPLLPARRGADRQADRRAAPAPAGCPIGRRFVLGSQLALSG
jgi:hypothetical protein